jgi:hypothetical protein
LTKEHGEQAGFAENSDFSLFKHFDLRQKARRLRASNAQLKDARARPGSCGGTSMLGMEAKARMSRDSMRA